MRYLKPFLLTISALCLAVCASAVSAGPPAKPPAVPANIDISVAPEALKPGSEALITLRLEPIEGVKINKYPKIKLEVPASAGLNAEAKVEVGNDAPPENFETGANYFKTVDPVELKLLLDDAAPAGDHKIEGKLTYFYCVAASGFCAPKRVPVQIPVAIR